MFNARVRVRRERSVSETLIKVVAIAPKEHWLRENWEQRFVGK